MPKWAEVIRPPPRERLKKAASAFDDADWPVGEFVASQPKQKKERPLLSSCSIAAATLLELAVFVPLSGRERTEQAAGSSALPRARLQGACSSPSASRLEELYFLCGRSSQGRRRDGPFAPFLYWPFVALLAASPNAGAGSAAAAFIYLCTFMDSCRPTPYCAFLANPGCLVSVVCIAPLFFF